MDRIPVSSFPAGLKRTQGCGPFVFFCVGFNSQFSILNSQFISFRSILRGGKPGVILEKAEEKRLARKIEAGRYLLDRHV